jgi:hypothetical protein
MRLKKDDQIWSKRVTTKGNEMNYVAVNAMAANFKPRFEQLFSLQVNIRDELKGYADGKNLKGYELVGWLGEIYVKLLVNGRLVHDKHEHDVETSDGWRISVKARKGRGSGWQQTSSIPKLEGDDCPSHLAFVHLQDDYSLDRIWLFEWPYLCSNNRFTPHIVRGNLRSYIFKLDEKRDHGFVIYPARADQLVAHRR